MQEIPHGTTLEINLRALKHNFEYYRSLLLPTTRLACMVKANAYGMGAVEIARHLQEWGCDYLAVAFVGEGVTLRQADITLPILVLDPNVAAIPQMVANRLEPEIYSLTYLQQFTDALQRLNVTDYPVHIKIDSGMHRAGFQLAEISQLIDYLHHHPQLHVISTFSHLVGADDSAFDSFTHQQIGYFNQCADQLAAALPYPIIKHILNSAGIERFTQHQMDMVRLGIGLWGIGANTTQLQNVVTLRTTVAQLRHVPHTETIGYSRKGTLTHDATIALLPVGYADGINRHLGNGHLQVYVNGTPCPTVGNICMDLMMIDVTAIKGIKEGDTVTIFDDNHPASEIARALDTIPYEIYTSISQRIPRHYLQ